MNCEDARALAGAYFDGELDLTRSLEVEAHLAECAGCDRAVRGLQAVSEAVSPLYARAPAGLEKRVRVAVRREAQAAQPRGRLPWQYLGAAAALALVAIIAWGLTYFLGSAPRDKLVAQEVLSTSMRSLMVGPLTDVQSSDRHTVKPWFAGRLDFSPVVQDFAAQGFPLAGGRMDYVGGRPVAALVYRHQQHVINLYTWPAGGATPVEEHSYQGYNLLNWTQGGATYWAVSDMDPAELRQFAALVQGGS